MALLPIHPMIEFVEVGRGRHTWTTRVKQLSHGALLRAVKQKGALMSSDIEFGFDDETQEGAIFVGGFRKVGRFRVIDEADS